jgi:RNA polymerase sigma factor (sigma-70 family)
MSADAYENACTLDSHGLGVSCDGLSDADLRALYESHRPEILRYAVRCAGRREVAEELTNEAFLRMLQNREAIDAGRAAAWLTTTVKHLATDYWRRQSLERKHALSLVGREPEAAANWPELLQSASLNAEHRACLTLHYVHGMQRKEIVSHTGLTEHQVKNCLQYGLALLRKAMGRSGESRE